MHICIILNESNLISYVYANECDNCALAGAKILLKLRLVYNVYMRVDEFYYTLVIVMLGSLVDLIFL